MRTKGDQDFHIRCLEQFGNGVGLQEKIDRHGITDRLCAPQGHMGFHQRGQHIGHARCRAPQFREHIGGPPDHAQQLAVVHPSGLFVRRAGHQHGDGRGSGMARRAGREHIQNAALRQPMFKCHFRLETRDIFARLNALITQICHQGVSRFKPASGSGDHLCPTGPARQSQ